ncbi:MAG: sulfurtransferase [Mogibacterium sp.]|nr:sulfurtransferase [Mogibacterium sp.]
MEKKKILALILCLFVMTLMTACSSSNEPAADESQDVQQTAEEEQSEGFTGDMIISAEDAAALIGNEDVIFVDCTGEANKGTVKGAVATTWQELCTCSEEYGNPGDEKWGKIPEAADLSSRLGALGLDKNKQIITLGHTLKGWGEDARIAWELRAAGYKNVKIVDGGIDALFDAGAEKQSGASDPVPCEVTVDSIDMSHVMETSELAANFDQYKIVDVRTDAEYNGATKYGEANGGHIKGAVFVPYLDFFQEDGTLKTNDEITELFESQGVSKTDKVVAYCTGGIRSAYAQIILEMCGFENTYNYDQSYWNWCVDNEVE